MSTYSDDGWGSPEPHRNKSFDLSQNVVQNESILDEPSHDESDSKHLERDYPAAISPTQDNSCSYFSDPSDESVPIIDSPNQTPMPRADVSHNETKQCEPSEVGSSISSTLSESFSSVFINDNENSVSQAEPDEVETPAARDSKPVGFGEKKLPVEVSDRQSAELAHQSVPKTVEPVEKSETAKSKPAGFGGNNLLVDVNDQSKFGSQQTSPPKPAGFGNSVLETKQDGVKPSGFPTNRFESNGSTKPVGFSTKKLTETADRAPKRADTSFANSSPFGVQATRSDQQGGNSFTTTNTNRFEARTASNVRESVQKPGSRVGADFQPPCTSSKGYESTVPFERSSKSKEMGSVTPRFNPGFHNIQEKDNYPQNKKQENASNVSDDGWNDDDCSNTKARNMGIVTSRTNCEFTKTQENHNHQQKQKQVIASNVSDDGWDDDDVSNANTRTDQSFLTTGAKRSQQEGDLDVTFSTIQEEEVSFLTLHQQKDVHFEKRETNTSNIGRFGNNVSAGFNFSVRQGASASEQQNRESSNRQSGGFVTRSFGTFGNNMSSNFDNSSDRGAFSRTQQNRDYNSQNRGLGSMSSGGFGSGQVNRNTQGQQSAGFGSRAQNGTSESAGFGRSSGNKVAFGDKNDSGFVTNTSIGFGSRTGLGSTNREVAGETAGRRVDRGCYNCGDENHISKECPNPQKPKICRNCGEEGHIFKECTQPKKTFEGCYNCRQEGHTANECENPRVEPTEPCPRCQMEGHWSRECPTRPRDLAGNLLVSHEFVEKAEDELFEKNISKSQWWNEEDQDIVISMAADVKCPEYSSFDGFPHLEKLVLQNLKRMKLEKPMPAQRAAFLPIMNGSDIVACAHTGCGKTVAFLLPLVTRLMQSSYNSDAEDDTPSPRLLIISPTRELALQTYQVVQMLTYKTDIKKSIAYGGISRSGNLQQLQRCEKLGILVATMGRLKDFVESGDISLDKLRYVVLDEADRMVDSSDFGEEVVELFGNPNERKAQMVLFSASFKDDLQKCDLINVVKSDFVMITVNEIGTANRNIKQNIIQVEKSEKRSKLFEILGIDENYVVKPDARVQKEKTLIFVNTVKFADILATFFSSSGVPAVPMHSAQDQLKRESNIADFEAGAYSVMVTSNVSARGLDIKGLNHVINYDLPGISDFDEYVNRIGRTGRAGFHGESTTFLDPYSDSEIIVPLVFVLQKAGKPVPDWLLELEKSETAQKPVEEEEEW